MAVNSNPPVQLDPSQDTGHQLAFINQNFQNLANSLNPFILSDGTNNRLLMGKDSLGNYVLKIAKAGFDAFNASDANLNFNSSQDVFKIVSTATVPWSYSGGTSSTLTIPHGQSFVPIPLVFLGVGGSGYYSFPYFNGISVGASAVTFSQLHTYDIDTTNLYIRSYYTSGSFLSGGSIKYYLLQETAN